ncbi:MAG: hypothetical protein IT256_04150 [Chitinophagaceae bacterium]|nr:hypothetical protein [Chitinophagaceae bacterium]
MRNNRSFRIDLTSTGQITQMSAHIGMVNEKDVLCRFTKSGYLEIAMNNASAAAMLGFKTFSGKQKFYSSVKIFFE